MSPRRLRLHILTEEDPFYPPVFFREFLAELPRDRFEVLGVDIDLGSILLQGEVPLNGDRSLDLVICKMKREGAQTLIELLERYRAGAVEPMAMDRSCECYHSFPGRAEAQRFRHMGYRLV